jgi:hypothetical protein
MIYIHDRCAHSGKVYLHDRPANRQRMRMGYIHDGRVNYIREFYLHDRPANRQCIRMGYIHDGRVNYIREFYYTTMMCGIDNAHGGGYLAFLCIVFISSFMAHAGICPRSIINNCQKKNPKTTS